MLKGDKRIAVNTLASYARSVIGVIVSLLVARWALRALGSSDFGIYGVVCGVTFVFSFLTPSLAGAFGRFFAYYSSDEEQVRIWFNSAFLIMGFLATLVLAIFPFGRFVLDHWLAIPDGRISDAKLALAFTLISAAVSMMSVPYTAMFTAKQDIVETSFWQLVQSVMTGFGVGVVCWTEHCDLVMYAAVLCGVNCFTQIAFVIRARIRYAECRLMWRIPDSKRYLRELLGFSWWQVVGGFAWTVRSQGLAFFVNVLLGTTYNASYTISNQVGNQVGALSVSLNNAMGPAIASAEGAGNAAEVARLARRGSLIGGCLVLLFAIPISIFINPILGLWLVNPPPGCGALCMAMMGVAALRQFASGFGLVILARGKLAAWQICDSLAMISSIPIAYALWCFDFGILAVGWAYVSSECLASILRYVFYRNLTSAGDIRS